MDIQLLQLYAQHGSFTKATQTLEQQSRQWLRESLKGERRLSTEAKREHKKIKSKFQRVLLEMSELSTVGDALRLDDYLSEALAWNDKWK